MVTARFPDGTPPLGRHKDIWFETYSLNKWQLCDRAAPGPGSANSTLVCTGLGDTILLNMCIAEFAGIFIDIFII